VALFVNSLFPLIDNFEIAIKQDNNPKEIESLYKTLQDFMGNLNIVEVPGVGELFDPNFHEAVEHSGDGDTQTIEEVLRKGYTLEDKLLRPAMVRVKSE
jgi:molecular chaperone GrpE